MRAARARVPDSEDEARAMRTVQALSKSLYCYPLSVSGQRRIGEALEDLTEAVRCGKRVAKAWARARETIENEIVQCDEVKMAEFYLRQVVKAEQSVRIAGQGILEENGAERVFVRFRDAMDALEDAAQSGVMRNCRRQVRALHEEMVSVVAPLLHDLSTNRFEYALQCVKTVHLSLSALIAAREIADAIHESCDQVEWKLQSLGMLPESVLGEERDSEEKQDGHRHRGHGNDADRSKGISSTEKGIDSVMLGPTRPEKEKNKSSDPVIDEPKRRRRHRTGNVGEEIRDKEVEMEKRKEDMVVDKVHRKGGRNGENTDGLLNKQRKEEPKDKPTPERSIRRTPEQSVSGVEDVGRKEPRVRKQGDQIQEDPAVTGGDQQVRVRRKRREQNTPDTASPKGRMKRDLGSIEKIDTFEPVKSTQEQTPHNEKRKGHRNKQEVPSGILGTDGDQSLEKNANPDKDLQHKGDKHTQDRQVKAEQAKSKDGLDNTPSKEVLGNIPADQPRRVRKHRSRNDNEQAADVGRQGEHESPGAEASVSRKQKTVSNQLTPESASKTPEGARQHRVRRADQKGESVQDKNIDVTPRKSDSAPNETREGKDSKQNKTESTPDSVFEREDSRDKKSPEPKVSHEDKTEVKQLEGNSVRKEPSHQIGDTDKALDRKSPPRANGSSKERKIHRRTVSHNAHILDDDQPERSIHRRTASQNSSVNDKRGGRKHEKKRSAPGESRASLDRTEPTETSIDTSSKAPTSPQLAPAEFQEPSDRTDPSLCAEIGSKSQTETSAKTVKRPGTESTENKRDETLDQFDTLPSPRSQMEKDLGIPPMDNIAGNPWNDSGSDSQTEELPQSLSSGNMEFASLLSQNNSSDPSPGASQQNQTQDNTLPKKGAESVDPAVDKTSEHSQDSLNGQSKELDSLFRSGESLNDSRSFVDPGPPIPSADVAPFHLYPENDEAHFSPLVTATDSTLDIDSSLFPTEPNFPAPLESEMDSLHFPTYKMSGRSNNLDTDEQSDSLCIGPSVKRETDNSDSESMFFKKQHSGEWLSSSTQGSGSAEGPDGSRPPAKEHSSED